MKLQTNKRLQKCGKPFWCDDLQRLWQYVFDTENQYLETAGVKRK